VAQHFAIHFLVYEEALVEDFFRARRRHTVVKGPGAVAMPTQKAPLQTSPSPSPSPSITWSTKSSRENDLTPRGHQILDVIGQGMSNKEIGRRLEISDQSVKTHPHACT